jgi:hypothetical protein
MVNIGDVVLYIGMVTIEQLYKFGKTLEYGKIL